MNDGEKNAWIQKKHMSQHVNYHIILENLNEYRYQCLDSGMEVHHLLNDIRSDKLPVVIVIVRVHPNKYENNFDAVVTYLSQYIDKRGPTPSVKVASITQTRPAKRQKILAAYDTFQGKIELKKYIREKCVLMSMA